MDWGNVTGEELLDALREVEWSTPPRPLAEFLQRFSIPKNSTKWRSRLKCNVYYYRTNYYILACFIHACCFARNPLALLAVSLSSVSLACLNDSFAISFSERLTRAIRKLSPPLAAKLRPPQGRTGVRGRPLKGVVHILGQDRRVALFLMLMLSSLLIYLSRAYITVCIAFTSSVLFVLVHATFRSPNLKARLNSYREEFRAVWRGYSDAP